MERLALPVQKGGGACGQLRRRVHVSHSHDTGRWPHPFSQAFHFLVVVLLAHIARGLTSSPQALPEGTQPFVGSRSWGEQDRSKLRTGDFGVSFCLCYFSVFLLSVSFCVCLSASLSLSVCLSVCLSVSVSLSVCQSLSLSLCLSVSLSSACICVYVSVYVSLRM